MAGLSRDGEQGAPEPAQAEASVRKPPIPPELAELLALQPTEARAILEKALGNPDTLRSWQSAWKAHQAGPKRRGRRPVIADESLLDAVADRIVSNPKLKPATAIRIVVRALRHGERTVRRGDVVLLEDSLVTTLYRKWTKRKDYYLSRARARQAEPLEDLIRSIPAVAAALHPHVVRAAALLQALGGTPTIRVSIAALDHIGLRLKALQPHFEPWQRLAAALGGRVIAHERLGGQPRTVPYAALVSLARGLGAVSPLMLPPSETANTPNTPDSLPSDPTDEIRRSADEF